MEDIKLNAFVDAVNASTDALFEALDYQFEQTLEREGWEYKVVRPINYLHENSKEIYNNHTCKLFEQVSDLINEARKNYRNRGKEIAQCYINDLLNQVRLSVEGLNCQFSSIDAKYNYLIEYIKTEASEILTIPMPFKDSHFSILEQALHINNLYFTLIHKIKFELPDLTIDEKTEKNELGHVNNLKFTVSNKQVYDVFKQLKQNGWINNTLEEIAAFINHHVEFKDNKKPTLSTIRAEVARNDRPMKAKRFTTPPTE